VACIGVPRSALCVANCETTTGRLKFLAGVCRPHDYNVTGWTANARSDSADGTESSPRISPSGRGEQHHRKNVEWITTPRLTATVRGERYALNGRGFTGPEEKVISTSSSAAIRTINAAWHAYTAVIARKSAENGTPLPGTVGINNAMRSRKGHACAMPVHANVDRRHAMKKADISPPRPTRYYRLAVWSPSSTLDESCDKTPPNPGERL